MSFGRLISHNVVTAQTRKKFIAQANGAGRWSKYKLGYIGNVNTGKHCIVQALVDCEMDSCFGLSLVMDMDCWVRESLVGCKVKRVAVMHCNPFGKDPLFCH